MRNEGRTRKGVKAGVTEGVIGVAGVRVREAIGGRNRSDSREMMGKRQNVR